MRDDDGERLAHRGEDEREDGEQSEGPERREDEV